MDILMYFQQDYEHFYNIWSLTFCWYWEGICEHAARMHKLLPTKDIYFFGARARMGPDVGPAWLGTMRARGHSTISGRTLHI